MGEQQGFHEDFKQENVALGLDRSFGLVFAGVFALIGAFKLWRGHAAGGVWCAVVLVFLVLAVARPKILAPLNHLWLKFGLLLHKIVNPIVLAELAAYALLVTPGSYIIATDGVMRDLANVPGGGRDWEWNNPAAAAEEFAADNSDFVIDPPSPFFNESRVLGDVTYWPSAWLRRKLPGEN